ncbi:MAG: class I SAM-dependent methyltransferase [Acidobacteria bacterium]|nr:class I SAM-dependent methyltransferase [Acidobacteriota bacterium]
MGSSDRPDASPGAAEWYEAHASGVFLEACYGSAPPRIRRALEQEIAFLESALPRTGRVLEVGCGDGRLLESLGAGPRRLTGIDFLESYLHQAVRARKLAASTGLTAASAGDLPFPDRSFDALYCAQNTLGLLGDLKERALREFARVIRPGGIAVIVVYSPDSLAPRAEWYTEMHRRGAMQPIDWARSGPELLITGDGHGSECFRRERLERLFRGAGLEPSVEPLGEIYWAVRARR